MELVGRLSIRRVHGPGEATDFDMWEVSLHMNRRQPIHIRFRSFSQYPQHDFARAFSEIGATVAEIV